MLAGLLTVNMAAFTINKNDTVNAVSLPCIEQLDRGITAVNTGKGMLISWRFLADDSDDTVFKLYRNGQLIYTSNLDESTCFLDAQGTSSDTYKVESLLGDKVLSAEECKLKSDQSYFKIDLDLPTGSCSYVPLESSIGDADGDIHKYP